LKKIRHKTIGKLFLLIFAIVIGMGSLIYTETLVSRIKKEERKNIELWAEATRIISSSSTTQNLDFIFSIIDNNLTIPVILTDEKDSIISAGNFNKEKTKDPSYIKNKLRKIKGKTEPIIVNLENGHYNRIYYKDSILLTMLIYYPYVQLSIILLFILVSYLAFRSSRKAEQNQVWVGMSKETAHQLGTPTSSLSGWIEILQQKYPDISLTKELARDVERLEKVTERFSRIGSRPVLVNEDIVKIISSTIDYLKSRSSSKIRFITEFDNKSEVYVPINSALFEWVIENVSKNAIDAMEGNGTLTINLIQTEKNIMIDLSDTGKGIPKSVFKKIFSPGFTTKQRGWGLGLSLSKRIVEDYHSGKIFVRYSEVGKGSSIRIILNRDKI
jgi:nitrogen-specific signal transduction histidine kinase